MIHPRLSFFIRECRLGAEAFGETLGMCINVVFLLIVYIVAIGGTALIARLLGKHFLDVDMMEKSTYWIPREPEKADMEAYYRQF